MRWGVLSRRTLLELVRGLRLGVESSSRVDALLTISLLTGRSYSSLVDIPIRDKSGSPGNKLDRDVLLRDSRSSGSLSLLSELLLASPGRYAHCYLRSNRTLEFPLPREIAPCLHADSSPGPCSEEKTIEERLKELRSVCPQLTLPRIALARVPMALSQRN